MTIPRLHIDFMFYWSNRKDHSIAFDSFCSVFLDRNKETIQIYTNQFIYFYGASLGLYINCSLMVLIVFSWQLRSLKGTILFIAKTISKDSIGKVYQMLEKKVDHEVDIKNTNMLSKSQVSISLAIVGTIITNISNGANILRTANLIAFRFSEMFTFLKYPSPSTYLNDARLMIKQELGTFHNQNKDQTGIITSSWGLLYYGATDTGKSFYGVYSNVDKAINPPHNCTYNGTSISFKCLGMNDLIIDLTTKANEYGENYGNYSVIQEFTTMLSFYEMTGYLLDKMMTLFQLYTNHVTVPALSLIVPFSVIGYCLLFFLCNPTYSLLKDFWYQNQQIRSMLNYLSIEVLESNEDLKSFVLFGHLPSVFNSKGKSSLMENADEKVRSILNSSVDGAIICNAKAEVELFNPAAQKMFGMTNSDVLGLHLSKLFDQTDSNLFKKVEQILHEMTTSLKPFGEKIDCVRKNMSKFPASINLLVSIFNNRPIVSCFLKDITPEKKQSILLVEEKKKSEGLLLNILPENVAIRLKSG